MFRFYSNIFLDFLKYHICYVAVPFTISQDIIEFVIDIFLLLSKWFFFSETKNRKKKSSVIPKIVGLLIHIASLFYVFHNILPRTLFFLLWKSNENWGKRFEHCKFRTEWLFNNFLLLICLWKKKSYCLNKIGRRN